MRKNKTEEVSDCQLVRKETQYHVGASKLLPCIQEIADSNFSLAKIILKKP
jgi:hypothetical protein